MSAPTDTVQPADVQTIAMEARQAALRFVTEARVAVVDEASLQRAGAVRKIIGERQKSILEKLAKPKAWAYGLHKWFCELEAAALAPFIELDKYEVDQIRRFNVELERRRREQERALAEQQQREREAAAIAEAALLERAGQPELAVAVVVEAIATPPPVVSLPDVARALGIATRKRWTWRLVDVNRVPREFFKLDEQKIGQYVRSMKESGAIAGIEIYSVDDPIR